MLLIISPSKTMRSDKVDIDVLSTPVFQNEYKELVGFAKKLTFDEVKKLMGTSDKLSQEVLDIYKTIPSEINNQGGNPALYAFKGDVYQGLFPEDFTKEEKNFAQNHLRILSGLYGVLKPLDNIYPYRLEMGSRLKIKKTNNLYSYWGKKITEYLVNSLEGHTIKVLINLASGEYFKSIFIRDFPYPIYNVEFKENKNGVLTGNSFTNKKMRGVMARYIIKHQIENPTDLIFFKEEGFTFSELHSDEFSFIFVRN